MTGPEPLILAAPERHVVGTVRRYDDQSRAQIPAQWQSFFDAGFRVPNAVGGAMYGVSFDTDASGNFRYAVGQSVDPLPESLPEGLVAVHLEPGEHAVLRAFGPASDIPPAFDALFAEWLPGSRFTLREGAVFERYPDDPRNGPDGMAWEIWVPVAPKPGSSWSG